MGQKLGGAVPLLGGAESRQTGQDRTRQRDRQTTVRWHKANRFTNGRPKIGITLQDRVKATHTNTYNI